MATRRRYIEVQAKLFAGDPCRYLEHSLVMDVRIVDQHGVVILEVGEPVKETWRTKGEAEWDPPKEDE